VDYYKILRVGEKTPMNEIKQQYYKLAKMYHPDVNASNEALFK
jgi:DnaJ-class molecular chaperone